jgi:hypothetical protein
VQESFLLSARAYEEMGFKAQALSGYRLASKVLRDQLVLVEKTALRIDADNWPDVLAPQKSTPRIWTRSTSAHPGNQRRHHRRSFRQAVCLTAASTKAFASTSN